MPAEAIANISERTTIDRNATLETNIRLDGMIPTPEVASSRSLLSTDPMPYYCGSRSRGQTPPGDRDDWRSIVFMRPPEEIEHGYRANEERDRRHHLVGPDDDVGAGPGRSR